MKHAYWGVKCPNSDRLHLREYLGGYSEGFIAEPPDPYPDFKVEDCDCGQTHIFTRRDLQVVEGPEPVRKVS